MTLYDLDRDVLSEIFSLISLKDCGRLSLVNRNLYEMCNYRTSQLFKWTAESERKQNLKDDVIVVCKYNCIIYNSSQKRESMQQLLE